MADVQISTAEDLVTISVDEYGELIAESTILRVIEKLANSFKYDSDKLLAIRSILELGEPEPESDHLSVPDVRDDK